LAAPGPYDWSGQQFRRLEKGRSMKTPGHVIPPLTEDQKRQVAEIEARIEEELRRRPECRIDKRDFRDEGTGIAEAVWEAVISNARNAEWEVFEEGVFLLFRKPRR
jgi:hypothetical protein